MLSAVSEAEQLYLEIIPMEHRNLSDDHYATFSSLMGLAKAYIHMGDYEKAREWRAKLPKTEAEGK